MATKQLNFSIDISAPKEKVWQVLWNDETYRQWTRVFNEGSYAVSDWKEGSKALFLGPDGSGMYSEVAKAIPNELMSFRHLGVVKGHQEQPMDEETKKWSGAMENYLLSGNGATTHLQVELDTIEGFEDFFNKTFPRALEEVKRMAES